MAKILVPREKPIGEWMPIWELPFFLMLLVGLLAFIHFNYKEVEVCGRCEKEICTHRKKQISVEKQVFWGKDHWEDVKSKYLATHTEQKEEGRGWK